MDELTTAVDGFVQRLENAIAPGLSFKQFIEEMHAAEDSVLSSLGGSALDHSSQEKIRHLIAVHRVRLQQECQSRYEARCGNAQQQVLSEHTGQRVFQNYTRYSVDPACLTSDWDEWSSCFLSACGQGGDGDLGEESRILLQVLQHSATQLIAAVKAEAQQQVSLHKQIAAKANERLDQSTIEVIKLAGEKENNMAMCRAMETRLAELQLQHAAQAAIVRDLQSCVSASALEAEQRRQEAVSATLKLEPLVARLVAKTKEAAALAAENGVLALENETLRRVQRHQAQAGGKRAGGKASAEAEVVLREMSEGYGKQVLELQGALTDVTSQLEQAREARESAERQLVAEQERRQQQAAALQRSSQQLGEALADCSRLEGKVRLHLLEKRVSSG